MTSRGVGGLANGSIAGQGIPTPSAALKTWLIIEWILFAIWVAGALVTMYPALGKALHLYGGLFSSYAADLAFPPWFYIQLRRRPWRVLHAARKFGSSPELAAAGIFVVGLLSELSQIYWPNGIFRGTFDPFDIAAYAAGLLVCYIIEIREFRNPAATLPPKR